MSMHSKLFNQLVELLSYTEAEDIVKALYAYRKNYSITGLLSELADEHLPEEASNE